MQPTSTVRGNLGTCSLSPSQRRPPRGACVSESSWSPAPWSLRAPIGRRFSPGEDQRGGGWSQAGALELRMTGVPGPRPPGVGWCLLRYRGAAGVAAGRDLGDHRVSDSCTAPARGWEGGRRGTAYTRMRCETKVPCCFGEVPAPRRSPECGPPGTWIAAGVWVGGFAWSVGAQPVPGP